MATLNVQAMEDRRLRSGLTQAALARNLGVSREAVSKWFRGDSVPQPSKLLRLGMALDMTFDDLVIQETQPAPVVRFRRKANRKTKPEILIAARDRGALLSRLVEYLPERKVTRAPTLKRPSTRYAYVQRVVSEAREEMGIAERSSVEFKNLIGKFRDLSAVVVPVLWGARKEHGNALHVYLPDSETSWVFLNLDSNAVDFNFWMAHELGHSLAPMLEEDKAEAFADAFAQAFLFTGDEAARLRSELEALPSVGHRVNRIKREAAERVISPWTIRKAVEAYERAHHLERVDLGLDSDFMGAVRNFGKEYRTMTEALFDDMRPSPEALVSECKKFFQTPFFDALAAFCRKESGGEHFIHQLLGLPLSDARALAGELAR